MIGQICIYYAGIGWNILYFWLADYLIEDMLLANEWRKVSI